MTKKKRTGGRKPGSWTLLTKDDLIQWRKKNKVSRRTLAKAIKSSSTSIQNWEMGKSTPITKFQKKIVWAMNNWGAPAAKAPPSKAPPSKAQDATSEKRKKHTARPTTKKQPVVMGPVVTNHNGPMAVATRLLNGLAERTNGVVAAAQEVRARSVELFMNGDTDGATALRDMASDLFERSGFLAGAR